MESTFERVTRTKVLRIAALAASPPSFFKDALSGTWSGYAVAMAKDIAAIWDAQVEYVESTYGNSVLDLQSNKIDLAFALNPTPARALSIGFTVPAFVNPFGCIAHRNFAPSSWGDIDKPDIRVAVDIGSLNETVARRFAPKSVVTAYRTPDDAKLALQSGRADAVVLASILGISAVGRNPSLGAFRLLGGPTVALPSSLGVQREADKRFVEVVDAWLELNRGTGQIREWMIEAIEQSGGRRADIPPELSF